MKNAVQKVQEKLQEGIEFHEESIGDTLKEIWILKFLNIWRNPWSVKKFLNTFKEVQKYYPTDHELLALYQKIEGLKQSDVLADIEAFGISLSEYKAWLKGLFLLLMPNTRGPQGNIIEQLAHNLLTNESHFRAIELHTLSSDFHGRFLLSDRGYFYSSEPDADHLILNFNITDRLAMKYMLVEPSRILRDVAAQHPEVENFDSEVIRRSQAEFAKSIQLRHVNNNEEQVKWFNRATIFQARSYVFCSQKDVLGATVIPPDGRLSIQQGKALINNLIERRLSEREPLLHDLDTADFEELAKDMEQLSEIEGLDVDDLLENLDKTREDLYREHYGE